MRRPSHFEMPTSKKIKIDNYLCDDKPLIDQDSLTRLLCMQLYNMGFSGTAQQLQIESNVQMEHKNIKLLRHSVLKGNWTLVYSILSHLNVNEDTSIRQICYKQELLELLFMGNRIDAVFFIRQLSGTLSTDSIESFSQLLMLSEEELFIKYSDIQSRRLDVLHELEDLFPKSLMIPPRRLEELLLQSFEYQKQHCLYHNKNDEFSLFQDHQCSSDLFPSIIKFKVKAHHSEIWALDWNFNGTLLATGGKDSKIKLWDLKGDCIADLISHSDSITKLKFSPNNKFLLSGSSNSCVKLWDLTVFNY